MENSYHHTVFVERQRHKILQSFKQLSLIFLLTIHSTVLLVKGEGGTGLDRIGCSKAISTLAFVTVTSTECQLRHPSNILQCPLIPKLIYDFLEGTDQNETQELKRPLVQKSRNKLVGIFSLATTDFGRNEKLVLLERLTISSVNPFVHKNEEVVLMHIHPSNLDVLEDILLSPFGRKLKYKAAIDWNVSDELTDSSSLSVRRSEYSIQQSFYSSCEFCLNPRKLYSLNQDPSMDTEKWADSQKNFHRSKLRISTPPAGKPRLNYTLGQNGKYQMENGLLTYVLRYAQTKLNFSIELKPTSRGGGTGTQLENGTWTGVISDILYGHADIGMITAETCTRSKVVGFTRGFVVESVVLVTGPPKRVFVWESIFWPLTPTTWATLLVTTSISVIMMKLSFLVLSTDNKNEWGLLETTEFIFKTLLNQSTPVSRRSSASLKIYVAVWLLCGSIITTAYLSKLVGFLTFPVLEKAPQTAEELGESSDYSWALTYLGGAAHALIKASKSKGYEQIYNKLELATDFVRCLTRTLESKFVCISYDTVPKSYLNNRIDLQRGESPFLIAPVPLLSLPVGMSMEKRAVFSPNFDDVVGALETSGLIPIWEQMDFRKIRQAKLESPQKSDILNRRKERINEESDRSSLTLNHFQGAFAIMVFGSLGSIVIICCEILLSRYNRCQFSLVESFYA